MADEKTLIELLEASVKNNPQAAMWLVFDVLLAHYKKRYKTPIEMLERDLQSSFNIWNPALMNCSRCGGKFPDDANFQPIGYADFKSKKFCSVKCAEIWLEEYRKNTKPERL